MSIILYLFCGAYYKNKIQIPFYRFLFYGIIIAGGGFTWITLYIHIYILSFPTME